MPYIAHVAITRPDRFPHLAPPFTFADRPAGQAPAPACFLPSPGPPPHHSFFGVMAVMHRTIPVCADGYRGLRWSYNHRQPRAWWLGGGNTSHESAPVRKGLPLRAVAQFARRPAWHLGTVPRPPTPAWRVGPPAVQAWCGARHRNAGGPSNAPPGSALGRCRPGRCSSRHFPAVTPRCEVNGPVCPTSNGVAGGRTRAQPEVGAVRGGPPDASTSRWSAAVGPWPLLLPRPCCQSRPSRCGSHASPAWVSCPGACHRRGQWC